MNSLKIKSNAKISVHGPLFAITGLYAILATVSAHGQYSPQINADPPQRTLDANGVDMTNGVIGMSKLLISGGDPNRPLSASVNIQSGAYAPDVLGLTPTYAQIDTGQGFVGVVGSPIGHFVFRIPPHPTGTPAWSLGSEVGARVGLGNIGDFVVNRNGDRLTYGGDPKPYSITYADGEVWTYYGLKFVVSSRGYGIQVSDNSGSPTYSGELIKRITFYNKAFTYCDEARLVDCATVLALGTTATITQNSPTDGFGNLTYSSEVFPGNIYGTPKPYLGLSGNTYAAPGEQGLSVVYGEGDDGNHHFFDVLKIKRLGAASVEHTYKYVHIPTQDESNQGRSGLFSASDGVSTWMYDVEYDEIQPPSPFSSVQKTATDPNGNSYTGVGMGVMGVSMGYTDELGRGWGRAYEYPNTNMRLTGIGHPEGDYLAYASDSRGNLISERHVGKPGSGIADVTRYAVYPTDCSNYLSCNKPTSVTDFRGNQTDITYNSDNGNVATITGPADSNGVRPQTRNAYVQRYVWILNGSGGYVHSGSPIWLLDNTSACRNSVATGNPVAPCAGNDEVKTTFDYGPDSGPNNLFLRGEAITANGVTLRTCFGNDASGRRIWTTKPRANLATCS